jgi:hypothetical protein
VSDESEIKRLVDGAYPWVAKLTWLGPVADKHRGFGQVIAVYVEDYNGLVRFAPFEVGADWDEDSVKRQFHRWNIEDGHKQLQSDLFLAYPTLDLNTSGLARCDCGAWSTSNPNCHAFWCSTRSKS